MNEPRSSARDRELARKVLSNPDNYPDEFKAWVPRQISGNPLVELSPDQIPSVERAHLVGEDGEPDFENGWGNNLSSQVPMSFYRDSSRVFLDGVVDGGSFGTRIFTLPDGYRPSRNGIYAVISGGVIGRVDIGTDGSVVAVSGNGAYVSLCGLSFLKQ